MNKIKRSAVSGFISLENQNSKEALKNYKKEMNICTSSFNLLSENIDSLFAQTAKIPFDISHIALLMAVYRLLGTMQSMRDLTLKRYYFESNILQRNFYETIGLCVYFKQNPDKAMIWLKGKQVEVSSIKLFNLVGKIYEAENKKTNEFNAAYGLLSNYVHSNARAYSTIVSGFIEDDNPVDGTVANSIGLKTPSSKCNYDLILDMVIQPCVLLFALPYLFENNFPEKRKDKILRFVAKQLHTLALLNPKFDVSGSSRI